MSAFLLIRHSKYSAIILKIHSYRLLFGDFTHWAVRKLKESCNVIVTIFFSHPILAEGDPQCEGKVAAVKESQGVPPQIVPKLQRLEPPATNARSEIQKSRLT